MTIQFDPISGLIPAIIQDFRSGQVLMLGYMNEEALSCTLDTGKVTFYSRSRQCLWVKGETSGHYLYLRSLSADCDQDSILIQAEPAGPTCHTGQYSCFGPQTGQGFIGILEQVIADKIRNADAQSYTSMMAQKGVAAMAQKVGEEAVEVVIEALRGDMVRLKEETADLLYHLLLLLQTQHITLNEIGEVLQNRHQQSRT